VGNSALWAATVAKHGGLQARKARPEGEGMAQHAPNADRGGDASRLKPAALAVADAARVLTRLGGSEVTEAMLRADIDAGAPTNGDGTLNLVHYAAWLVKEMARGDD
jgi:hypothetical protein